jgi:hypothetical protein
MIRCFVLATLAVLYVADTVAQSKATSPSKEFGPRLVVEASLKNPSGDMSLAAGERGKVVLVVKNLGATPASDVVASSVVETDGEGVSCERECSLGSIPAGQTKEGSIWVSASDTVKPKTFALKIGVKAGQGPVMGQARLEFRTKEGAPPNIVIDWEFSDTKEGPLLPGRDHTLTLRVKNVGMGKAFGLETSLASPPGDSSVVIVRNIESVNVGILEPGGTGLMKFLVAVRPGYVGDSIKLLAEVRERSMVSPVVKTIEIPVSLSPQSLLTAGMAHLAENRAEQAADCFAQALRLDSNFAAARFALGKVTVLRGETNAGIGHIEHAARLHDQDALRWLEENTTTSATASYKRLEPNPFAGTKAPISLGILSFDASKKRASPTAEEVYEALKAAGGDVRTRFTFYPHAALKDQQQALGVSGLDVGDKRVLKSLLDNLDIRFVMRGRPSAAIGGGVLVDLIRTEDGVPVLRQQRFRDSGTSSAIADLVKLFVDYMVPTYQEVRELKPGR